MDKSIYEKYNRIVKNTNRSDTYTTPEQQGRAIKKFTLLTPTEIEYNSETKQNHNIE